MRAALGVLLAVLLGACASSAPLPGREFEERPERTLYHVLREIGATDAQRVAVLNAYDRLGGQLQALQQQSQQLIADWRRLDRRDPAFPELARGLSERWAAIAAERLVTESAFERDVATALDEGQWRKWQSLMAVRPALSYQRGEPESRPLPR